MSYWFLTIALVAALAAMLLWNAKLRRQTQRSQASESRLHDLVNSTDGMFWEADAVTFTFSYISDSAERILDYTREDWLQPGFWAKNIHPDDQSWAVDYCAACTARLEPHDFEYRFITKSGEVVWLRDLVTVMEKAGRPDRLLGLMIDITDQKNTEQRLRGEREATFAILEGSPVACALSDSQQTFTYVNPAFTALLGYEVEDISPLKKWREAAYPNPEYRQWVGQNWQTEKIAGAKHGIVFSPTELDIRTKDGRKITVVASAAPYGEATDQVRLVIFHDVTERKTVENELILKNTLLATQMEASIDAVMMVDDQRRVIAANQRYIDLWGLTPDLVKPGADSLRQRPYKARLVDIDQFSDRLEDLYSNNRESSLEEITFKDGRVIDRYSAPMIGPDGNYFGRLWSLRNVTERKRSETMIWRQANYDALTNLPNRRMLIDRSEQEIKKARRNAQSFTVFCLDLDHFKEVNDTLGHAVGDVLLQQAAARLKSCVRDTDIVARLGGDEFVLVLTEINQPGDVERVANKILDVFREPFALGNETAYVSTSIGITFFPQDAGDVDALLKNADQAMYAAKRNGRCGFHYFTESMQEQALIRMRTLNDLRTALPNGELHLVYQPIVALASGEVAKAEALLRWQHPTRGPVSPAEFISIAEESGMIVEIGDWLFHEATRQASLWRDRANPEFQISINTSPIQFIDERRQFDRWFEHLERLCLPGDAVNMEITEGLLMEARDTIMTQLLAFRDAGIQVSIDDFGTGYSSLAYLKKFDIDFLKIDQSFVNNLSAVSEDMALCEAIIVMAHKLNLKVIAEGIETLEQRDLLLAAGCDFGQGYLFAAPTSAEELEALMTRPLQPRAAQG